MTDILMMTLTPQLRKMASKKRASPIRDKLEQAEITMKLKKHKFTIRKQYPHNYFTNN